MKWLATCCAILSLPLSGCSAGEAGEGLEIFCNQLGFYTGSRKIAAVWSSEKLRYKISDERTGRVVWEGESEAPVQNSISGKWLAVLDFSLLKEEGDFRLTLHDRPDTVWARFSIGAGIFDSLAKGALKGFYYQRASTALPELYAGKWKRAAGHSDREVLVHASAASSSRPVNSVISSPGGWYDAGDYNKYIVNSGISTATLLSLFEDFPEYAGTVEAGLPESGNGLPDLLNEALWNLRWMLTMQDPADGGVYHKLTNARFDGVVMPHQADSPRYVVQKSTNAALNFAAVMAQSARIFKKYEVVLPGLSDSCSAAARKAWDWSDQYPDSLYRQSRNNERFDPPVATGTYEDHDLSDERFWAATELWLATADDKFIRHIQLKKDRDIPVASWNQVLPLAYFSLVRLVPERQGPVYQDAKAAIVSAADRLVRRAWENSFRTVMGAARDDFMWGSSGYAANQGILLITAYRLTGNREYLAAAAGNLDYILGLNPTGYCFVTGFGSKRVMHPHHRPSEADGVPEPVPGLLSGGPNRGRQDQCATYPNDWDNEAFTDDYCSYASNEIAINWNAPLVYLVWGLNALSDKQVRRNPVGKELPGRSKQ